MRKNVKPILLLSFLLWITSCAKEVSQDELIQAAVQLKKEQWQADQLAVCKQKVYIKAEDYVDSLLVATSLDDKLDTIPKPGKPSKPAKPSFKSKPDSVIIDPIYDNKK